MPNWMKITGAWLLGVVVAVAFSWGAVAQVRNRVIEPSIEIPATVVAAATTAATSTTTSPTVIQVEPEIDDTTTASTSTTTQQGETTTTTRPVTATSQPPSTTTTTTSPPQTQTSSYQLAGGVVAISHSPGVVEFVSAVPQPGFTTDVEQTGPESVRVKFESESHTSEFRAEWEDGELEISRNEGNDD